MYLFEDPNALTMSMIPDLLLRGTSYEQEIPRLENLKRLD